MKYIFLLFIFIMFLIIWAVSNVVVIIWHFNFKHYFSIKEASGDLFISLFKGEDL